MSTENSLSTTGDSRQLQEQKRAEIEASKFSIGSVCSTEEFDTAVDFLCAKLLFGTQWENKLISNPRLRRSLPGLSSMPLLCKVEKCPYARVCPVLKIMPQAEWESLRDTACRADVVESTRLFAEQVQSLHISPENSGDIISVSSLVRLLLIQRRLDWELSLNEGGMFDERVDAINPLTGHVHYKRVSSDILKEQERVNKQIASVQSALASTRRDRLAQQNTERAQSNVLTQLLAASRVRKQEQLSPGPASISSTQPQSQQTTDAEYMDAEFTAAPDIQED